MKNIMVWGGVHPNEPIGMAVADSLMNDPIRGITAGIANPLARLHGSRFVDKNLNMAFPGDTDSHNYEERRAVEILELSEGYDRVIDFHGANFSRTDFSVMTREAVDEESLSLLGAVGITKVILSEGGAMLHDHVPRAFLLDIVEGGELADVPFWRSTFSRFVRGPEFPASDPSQFDWFEMIDFDLYAGLDRSVLPPDLGDFSPIPAEYLLDTSLPLDAHTMGHNPDKPSQFWPELCRPVAAPTVN